MLELSRCFLFALCCLSVSNSALLVPSETEQSELLKENKKADELQRRKEIAEGFINTLDKVKESWIDPYQMISCQAEDCMDILKPEENIRSTSSGNSKTFSDLTTKESVNVLPQVDSPVLKPNSNEPLVKDGSQAKIYLSRWLKKLLLLLEDETIDPSSIISFSLDEEILNHLKELSNDKTLDISQVDDLFSQLLNDAIISKRKTFDLTDMLDYTKYLVWIIAVGSIIVFFMYVFYVSSKYHPYYTCVFLFLVLTVFWHWMQLFQQRIAFKQSELSSMSIPSECRKHDLGFLEHVKEYFKSYFKSNDCVKYHEALSVDPIWEVSIAVAISEAAASIVLQPLSTSSRVLNSSLKQLFDGLTWEIKFSVIILFFLMFIMVFNYRIRLPWFMGAIEPSPIGSSVENIPPPKSLTKSSKEKVMMVLNYVEGKTEKAVEFEDFKNLPSAIKSSGDNVQQHTKPVKCMLRPFECCVNDCSDEPYNIGSVCDSVSRQEKIVAKDKNDAYYETNSNGINPKQSIDDSKKKTCVCLSHKNSKELLKTGVECDNTPKYVDNNGIS